MACAERVPSVCSRCGPREPPCARGGGTALDQDQLRILGRVVPLLGALERDALGVVVEADGVVLMRRQRVGGPPGAAAKLCKHLAPARPGGRLLRLALPAVLALRAVLAVLAVAVLRLRPREGLRDPLGTHRHCVDAVWPQRPGRPQPLGQLGA